MIIGDIFAVLAAELVLDESLWHKSFRFFIFIFVHLDCPCVHEDDCAFWNDILAVCIILCQHVWYTTRCDWTPSESLLAMLAGRMACLVGS